MMLVPLTRGAFAQVDDADFEMVMAVRWHLGSLGYAQRHELAPSKKLVQMHRFIIQAPHGLDVDHRNRDRLDNRRENLRLCTRSQNLANQRTRTGLFKGVSQTHRGSYVAKCTDKHLGTFADAESAARAYDAFAAILFGEFARLNFPDERSAEEAA